MQDIYLGKIFQTHHHNLNEYKTQNRYYLPNSTIQHSQIKKRGRGECDSSSFSPNLFNSPQNLGVIFFVPPVIASHIFQNYVSHFQGKKKILRALEMVYECTGHQ